METVRVRFENVGPEKKSWEDDLPSPLTVHSLVRSIKKQHALASNSIDFTEDEGKFGGSIYVGMFRKVGSWQVINAGGTMEENDRKDETTTETPATEAPTAETTAPVDQADGASTDPVEEKEPAPV